MPDSIARGPIAINPIYQAMFIKAKSSEYKTNRLGVGGDVIGGDLKRRPASSLLTDDRWPPSLILLAEEPGAVYFLLILRTHSLIRLFSCTPV